MKILHTSDWHIGRTLYGRKRYDEFEALLDWITNLIKIEEVDVLLISGDIFDTGTPSNRSQNLYYNFLRKIAKSHCRHIIIIAGNHDSPSFLNAPKELLKILDVHVIGEITESLEDEVIVLNDDQNRPEAIICAIPYLRDKDIRTVEVGESEDDKSLKLVEGIKNHYADVCRIAENKQKILGDIPIIAMGHLFTAGGKTIDNDGVRDLYIGSLAYIGKDSFPSSIDYLALGHLHVPQCVGGATNIRYSGSPIQMGYGEANQEKKVVLINFNKKNSTIYEITVPCFQLLERITGTLENIKNRIDELKDKQSNAWLEIEYTDSRIVGNLHELLYEHLNDTSMEILRIKNKIVIDRIINTAHDGETLDDINENDVFKRCLEIFDVPLEDHFEITQSYNEILRSLHEEDSNAE